MTDPVKVTVTVEGDPSNPTLTLNLPNVNLNPGDTLQWNFENVPDDCAPAIWFVSKGPLDESNPLGSLEWLGPFQAIESRGKNVVLGRGNVGDEGQTYNYKAQLLDAGGIRKESDLLTVTSLVSQAEQNTTPTVVIRCQTEVDSQTGETRVTRSTLDGNGALRLFTGDTALWYVFNLPGGYFVTFGFPPETNSDINNSPMGPFVSFLYSRGVAGDGPGGVGVMGTGFKPPSGAPDSFYYNIDIRDASGAVVAHHDPMIDNMGQPPGAGQGT